MFDEAELSGDCSQILDFARGGSPLIHFLDIIHVVQRTDRLNNLTMRLIFLKLRTANSH